MYSTPIDAPFGAQVHLGTGNWLTEEECVELRRLLVEHQGLLVVRDGPLSDERHIDLLSALGRLERAEDGKPLRMEVTNQHQETTAPEGELIFHYDYAYDPVPNPVNSLYALDITPGCTPTLFASSATVLDRLPEALVGRLRQLEAAHACFLHRLDAPEVRSQEPDPIIPRGEAGWGPEHYWARHPAIFRNSFGVETLFLCRQHTDRFVGLERAESDELLKEIYAVLYHPEHVHTHVWAPDDLVIWDNLTVQHARPEPVDLPRTLRRYHLSEVDYTAEYLRVARERDLV